MEEGSDAQWKKVRDAQWKKVRDAQWKKVLMLHGGRF